MCKFCGNMESMPKAADIVKVNGLSVFGWIKAKSKLRNMSIKAMSCQ